MVAKLLNAKLVHTITQLKRPKGLGSTTSMIPIKDIRPSYVPPTNSTDVKKKNGTRIASKRPLNVSGTNGAQTRGQTSPKRRRGVALHLIAVETAFGGLPRDWKQGYTNRGPSMRVSVPVTMQINDTRRWVLCPLNKSATVAGLGSEAWHADARIEFAGRKQRDPQGYLVLPANANRFSKCPSAWLNGTQRRDEHKRCTGMRTCA